MVVATEPLMLRLRDAARILNVSVWKLRELVRSGEIVGARYSNARTAPIWVNRESVLAYLDRRSGELAA